MRRKSLRTRLLVGGFIAMLIALSLAGFALLYLFERHVERRAIVELEANLETLLSGAEHSPLGKLTLSRQPLDPQFNEPLSGAYWQVLEGKQVLFRSRSLWDKELETPVTHSPSNRIIYESLQGVKAKEILLAIERPLLLEFQTLQKHYRVIVAIDKNEIIKARNDFAVDLIIALLLLGSVIFISFIVQISFGLKPLKEVREKLLSLEKDGQNRLTRNFPDEVIPLIDEINTLLTTRDEAISKARRRAADLAHGLKTPLTAMNADIRLLKERGQADLATHFEATSAMMQRYIQRELARIRLSTHDYKRLAAKTNFREALLSVIQVIAKMPQAEGKAFDIDCDETIELIFERTDLEEMLGNLLENAVRYAHSIIRIHASKRDDLTLIEISNDGEEISEQQLNRLFAKGTRLDETSGGAGLGITLVSELVEVYGGNIRLTKSDLGGLSVEIMF
jgi:signal transduction histidine kinase